MNLDEILKGLILLNTCTLHVFSKNKCTIQLNKKVCLVELIDNNNFEIYISNYPVMILSNLNDLESNILRLYDFSNL